MWCSALPLGTSASGRSPWQFWRSAAFWASRRCRLGASGVFLRNRCPKAAESPPFGAGFLDVSFYEKLASWVRTQREEDDFLLAVGVGKGGRR